MLINPQPKDIEGTVIQGSITAAPNVTAYSTTSGVWYPITLIHEESKQIVLQPRPFESISNPDWCLATASGSDYFTVRNGGALEASIVAVSGTVLCWVKSDYDLTYELLVGS